MTQRLFSLLGGIRIQDKNVEIHAGDVDPSTASGIAAPVGSYYFRTDGKQWEKFGSGDTEWRMSPTFDSTLTFIIDNFGAAILPGEKSDIQVPFACTIQSWTALADQTGNISVDIWKTDYANYPPTVANSIVGASPILVSGADKATDSTLSGWTTSVAAGDILRFNVNSSSVITRLTISLKVERSG